MFGIGSSENCEQKNLLYHSKVCRLCGEENDKGRPLFRAATEQCETSRLINQYLPVQVQDDGVSPRWICPGCHIQLESTAEFFEMILKGQQLISELLLQEKQSQEAAIAAATATAALAAEVGSEQNASKMQDRIDELYDTLDQAKWNELFGKPNLETTLDSDNVLVPLELFELEDLLEQEDKLPEQAQLTQEQLAPHTDEQEEHNQQTEAVPSYDQQTEAVPAYDDGCQGEEMDWIVTSELTKVNGRLIGFIQNHHHSDIGSLVVQEGVAGRKRTHARFVCDICSQIFVQEFRYLKHRKTHNILFECSVCLLKFSSSVKLMEHQQETKHNGKGIVEGLPLASDGVVETQALEDKTGQTQIDAYACDKCDDTFPELSTVLRHEESVHAGADRSFVCSDCGKSFHEKSMLQRHRDTHTDARPHQCTVCEATFKTSSTLSKHARLHTGGKRYQCTLCTQRFAYKTSLDLHLNWHNGVKPFECEFCSKRFSQRGNLNEHLRVHSGDKPFRCGICGSTFGTSSQHRLHFMRHTNDRPFECELCSKTFLQRENFKVHMRRHRNEKPYECDECPSAFTERWALRKHIRTHTREKPYSCNYCTKPFSDSSNLLRHVTQIHERQPKPKKKKKTEETGDDATPAEAMEPPSALVEPDEMLTHDATEYMGDH